jgi:hypothetical protein
VTVDDEPLRLLTRRLDPAFERRVHVLPPGCTRPVDQASWSGALAEVARGEVELTFTGGGSERFGAGEVLWFDGLPLRALRNPGRRTAVLVAIRRRRR